MNDELSYRFLQKRHARRAFLALAGSAGAAGLLAACGTKSSSSSSKDGSSNAGNVARPDGWTKASHEKGSDPDYDRVFPSGNVNSMTISVTPETWTAMLANMTALYGARDASAGGGAAPGGNQGGGRPQGGGLGGNSANPDWAKATVTFNGLTWTNVGFRFKGNSSLSGSWRTGTDKLPFKLDFDQWEGDHPEISDQRFYGFKQLSLSNNFGDTTGMRETLAYDLLGQAELVAARTAPYEVLLDRGDGSQSLGLYTVIEVIDDTVIKRAFKDDNGNIYEADGSAASFARGTDGQIEASFEAEGGDNPDWSDINALYNAIHADSRTSDTAAWRKGMEAVFDVDTFLKWLGLAATLQHWDTYGGMTHNYYLYNDPSAKKLTWISWDHNFVLGASMGGAGGFGGDFPNQGGPPAGGQLPNGGQIPNGGALPEGGNVPNLGGNRGGGFGGQSTSFDKKEVTEQWPLIRYLLDQPDYYSRYTGFLKDLARNVFKPDELTAWCNARAAILKPHADDATAYQTAVDSLTSTISARGEALGTFLATVS